MKRSSTVYLKSEESKLLRRKKIQDLQCLVIIFATEKGFYAQLQYRVIR